MPISNGDSEAAERQTLDEIREWYRGIVDALIIHRASVLQCLQGGSPVAARFVGMTEAELDDDFDGLRHELNRLTMLNLVASAEATVRVDFHRRINERLKDVLAKDYRRWHQTLSVKKKRLPDFDAGGILEKLKDAKVMSKHIIGEYRRCLRLRHWVGHGRYWNKPKEVDQLDPDDVYNRAKALLDALPE